jgi:hypothetical protein
VETLPDKEVELELEELPPPPPPQDIRAADSKHNASNLILIARNFMAISNI